MLGNFCSQDVSSRSGSPGLCLITGGPSPGGPSWLTFWAVSLGINRCGAPPLWRVSSVTRCGRLQPAHALEKSLLVFQNLFKSQEEEIVPFDLQNALQCHFLVLIFKILEKWFLIQGQETMSIFFFRSSGLLKWIIWSLLFWRWIEALCKGTHSGQSDLLFLLIFLLQAPCSENPVTSYLRILQAYFLHIWGACVCV